MSVESKNNYFLREYVTKAGKILNINQIEYGGVGCVVWDASIVLGKYLENLIGEKKFDFAGRDIIELGAGTGLISILLASYGFRVTVTDLKEIQCLLMKNVSDNLASINGRVECCELNWSDHELVGNRFGKKDVIFIADCIYYEESVEPLISCLIQMSNSNTIIYCSYEERDLGIVPQIQKRFLNLANKSFSIERVQTYDLDEFYQSDDIIVLKLKLK